MYNIRIMLGLLIVVSLLFEFCTQQKDVKGWDKVQWGMKEIDIIMEYKLKVAPLEEIYKDPDFYGSTIYFNLVLKNFEICGGKFNAYFLMDKMRNGRLKAVSLGTPEEELRNKNNIEIFKCLERRFIEQYGQTTVKEDKPVSDNGYGLRRRVWEFPSSILELKYLVGWWLLQWNYDVQISYRQRRSSEHAKRRLRELGTKYYAPKQQVTEPRTAQSINGQPVKQLSAGDWFQQGISFMNSERYDEAIEAFTRALEINPHDQDACFLRWVAWRKKAKLHGILYLSGIGLKPVCDNKEFQALVAKLEAQFSGKKTERRLSTNIWLRQGISFMNSQRYDDAINAFTEALEINPRYAEAYFFRGGTWYRKGDYDRAIADFTKALEINPGYAKAYSLRGGAWDKKGDYDRAIADYTKALEIDPRSAEAHSLRGLAWEKKGDYDRAIADFTKALEIDPRSAATFYLRGYAWEMKGDHRRALVDLKEALRLMPNDKELQALVAKLEAEIGSNKAGER